MKTSTLKSQSGFSLVELMVVVAIIGILAAMSVGQVQKQIAKARQSESKSALAALYTSETAFRAEYNTFVSDFGAMKLEYTGRIRYRVGFTADHRDAATVTAANGFAGTSNTFFSTGTGGGSGVVGAGGFCGGVGSCVESSEVIALAAATTVTQTAFLAEAAGDIYQLGLPDQFTIDHNKNILHPADGIP